MKISNKILISKMSSSEKNKKRDMIFGQPSGKASELNRNWVDKSQHEQM